MGEDLFGNENENVAPLWEKLRLKSSSSGRENKVLIMYISMVNLLRPLENETECGFLVCTDIGKEWNGFQNQFLD